MKKIVLTLASLLFASGLAVAGSDHFNADAVLPPAPIRPAMR